jgi:hypothetical protein
MKKGEKMTCLVLIITSMLIILAADDAVTLENRIYEGMEKIHGLSNDPPLAMMIYGNSDFGEIPLENLISEYIKKTNFGKINTVKKVKKDFLNYIHSSTESQTIDKFLNKKLIDFKKEIKELDENTINYYSTTLENPETLNLFKGYELSFDDVTPNSLSKNEKEIFTKNMTNIFFSKISTEVSGVVIAGIDKKTKRGSYTSFEMILNNANEVIIDNEVEEINIKKSCIKIFAQNDVIESFFNGIDETLIIDTSNILNQHVNDIMSYLLNQIKENKIINSPDFENIQELFNSVKENNIINVEFEDYIENLKIDNENNILSEIEGMPKEELINMAETLIQITRLKRILSSQDVTVGKNVTSLVLSLKNGIEKNR